MALAISPSQVKKFRLCPRRSAFQLVIGLKPEESGIARGNDLGTRCHEIAQAYLDNGTMPEVAEEFTVYRGRPGFEAPETTYPGQIVGAGLHLLPAPKSVRTEQTLSWEGRETVWKSRADFLTEGGIGDHKFVRDLGVALSADPDHFNSYGEPSYLGDDPQAVIQAGCLVSQGASEVPLDWIYYETKSKGGKHKARRVHLVLTRDEIEAKMEPLERTAAQIQAVFQEKIEPWALPPETEACHAYGKPCEYMEACGIQSDPYAQLGAAFKMEDTSTKIDQILADMKARKLGPSVPAPPPHPPEDIPPPPPPPEDDEISPPPPPPEPEPEAALVGPDPVNPPEAPPNDGGTGPVKVADKKDGVLMPSGGLEAMDRATLKAWLVERGIIKSGDRRGLPALLELAKGAETGEGRIMLAQQIIDLVRTATHPDQALDSIALLLKDAGL